MRVILEKHNPEWKRKFEVEKELLKRNLALDGVIEHIGSTSIEGLDAKPVIDIMIGLEKFTEADTVINMIINLGYEYISRYEDVMPYRRFFIKETENQRTHNIHMVQLGSEFWNRHLAFRNYLIANANEKAAYSSLKNRLAERDWDDVNDYAAAKTEFIREVERKALGK